MNLQEDNLVNEKTLSTELPLQEGIARLRARRGHAQK